MYIYISKTLKYDRYENSKNITKSCIIQEQKRIMPLMPRESHENKCGARKIAKNGTAIEIDILFRRNYWTDKLILKF